jgi:hypothetical protein
MAALVADRGLTPMGGDTVDWVSLARQIAAGTLAPQAAEVDRTGRIPESHFAELARHGFYGFPGAAGVSADEWVDTGSALIAGCLATGFVWAQHVGALRSLRATENIELRETYLATMSSGECRCCVSYAGALATPTLFLEEAGGDYRLTGSAPFVSGWSHTRALMAAALLRKDSDYIVVVMIPDKNDPRIQPSPLELVAAEATSTVSLRIDRLPVPRGHIVSIIGKKEFLDTRAVANDWVNGALAIGVLAGCLNELERHQVDASAHRAEAERLRRAYADARGNTTAVHRLRAEIAACAVNTAAATVVAAGARSVVAHSAAERGMRQAVFALVATTRDPIKEALFHRLTPARADI